MDHQRKAYLLALLAVLFWSTVAVVFKITLRHIDPYQIIFLASLFSFLFFLIRNIITSGWKGFAGHFTKTNLTRSALLGFLNPFLYYLILIHAYNMITAQEAMTLNYIWPIMMAILSVPLLGQRMGILSMAAMFLGFGGIVLIATKGDFSHLVMSDMKGDILAAGSSVIWALYWILNLRDRREIAPKLMLNFLFGTIYALIALLFFSTPVIPSVKGWLGGAYLGLFEMGFTFLLWLSALSYSRKTYLVGQLIYISPFLSLIWIWIILKEPVLYTTFAGLMLILAGIILQHRQER